MVHKSNGLDEQETKKKRLNYVGAQLPLPHAEHIPVPPDMSSSDVQTTTTLDTDFTEPSSSYSLYEPYPTASSRQKEPILISQAELDQMVATLELSQRKSEKLA